MELKKLKLTKRRSDFLQKMNAKTVEDILRIYPLRYDSRQAVPFSLWKVKDNVCFEGLICSKAVVVRFGKNRSMTKFKVISWNEELTITLFNRPWTTQFTYGKKITCFGTYQGQSNVTVAQYNFKPIEKQLGIIPVYSLTEGMKQSDIQAIIDAALPYADTIESVVPERLVKKYRLLDLSTVLHQIHKPQSQKALQAAIRTLKYEEFLRFQCVMQALHKEEVQISKKPKHFSMKKVEEFVQSFPYVCTLDQRKAIDDVLEDLSSAKIMFRIIQGDVGCGKTMVASTAFYAAYLSGCQSCFLAPTEILARQHYENLKKQGLPVYLYVSGLSTREKKTILESLADGSILLVVGTHALFQEAVSFKNLGFVIVDEQQRFGVRQRRSLLEKGKAVDLLMMSATPIPRTAAHFLFGDLDVSNIKTMPSGRKPVKTQYVPGSSMKPILKELLQGIKDGSQGYVVCPSIEENEETSLRSVQSIYEGMKKTLKDVSIALLHGKMSAAQKEETMQQFAEHKIDILVSTTVIEVGIDVPNATWMVIYDAHRFGLSTLHQLRGRVARGPRQGHCYLLSPTKEETAIERLKMLEKYTDGFSITEYDLKTRGPGDVLGFRQSGVPGFLFANLNTDQAMMECCVQDAKEILELQSDTTMLEYVEQALENASYFD
ncbi:ATP-dependent DNA helicase RecG [Faecalicoccus pleomorphus]|uniref:ATP-dependent DNA helicase RecG n=1 Tax=Faecalicoccus pleomorphus TaxID=1323 RepID=UPI0024308B5C|nr:ATP-dependent DNA helicase RecG [Faecalicoccus pleomorphus]